MLASELALGLAARGHSVHVFSHATPPRLLAESTVRVHASAAPPYPLFETPLNDLAMVSRILEVAQASGLDVLHAHYALPHAATALLARDAAQATGLADAPIAVVTTLHGTDITLVGKQPAFAPLVRSLLTRSDAISAVSRSLARETRRSFFPGTAAPPVEVISNFVDTRHFTPSHGPATGPVRIVHASNLRPLKRVPWLVEAFAAATAPGSDAEASELWLVGDGPERLRAERRASHLGVGRRVKFLGVRDDLAPILRGASAFALASEAESFGLSALEAMASSVATVACRVGGLPELVLEGTTGFLVDPQDQARFASRLRTLCVDHNLVCKMGQAARRRAVRHYSAPELIDRYESLYRRAHKAVRHDKHATAGTRGESWNLSAST